MIYINIIRNNSKILILTLVSLWNLQKKRREKHKINWILSSLMDKLDKCHAVAYVFWVKLIAKLLYKYIQNLHFTICLKTTKTKQLQCKKFELNQCIFAKIKLNSQFVSCSNCTCHFVQSLFDRMKWDWAHQMSDL